MDRIAIQFWIVLGMVNNVCLAMDKGMRHCGLVMFVYVCICMRPWMYAGGKNNLNFLVKFKHFHHIMDNFAYGAIHL